MPDDAPEETPAVGKDATVTECWTELRMLRQYNETVLGPTLSSLAAQITWTNQQVHAAMTALAASPLAAMIPQQHMERSAHRG